MEIITDGNVGTLIGDSDKLERILLNLLFNAIKFTPAGGNVQITASRVEDELILVISDTGTGISQEQLPFIFDRFWQADTSAQTKESRIGYRARIGARNSLKFKGGEVSVR